MELFSFLKKNIRGRFGIITSDVEVESRNALRKAVIRQLERKYPNPQFRPPNEVWFKVSSFLLGACEDRLRTLSSVLERHPIDNEDAEMKENLANIWAMYFEFQKKAAEEDAAWKATFQTRHVPKRYQKMMYPVYKKQEINRTAQVIALRKSLPSQYDVLFLAQAISLKSYFESSGQNVAMYLTSCDTLLSPKWMPGGIQSRPITDEIARRFGIT